MGNLFLMCGLPGSGKSTFLKNHIKKNKREYEIISRDEIRFSLLKPDEDYFSHEKNVTFLFWQKINDALAAGKDVYADQTSLTPKSRFWFASHVFGYDQINVIWVYADLKTCLERNENRKGTERYVPKETIWRMKEQFVPPSPDEGFDFIFKYNSETDEFSYKGKKT